MASARNCTVCGKGFEPRFKFQIEEVEGLTQFYCTQKCQQSAIGARKGAAPVGCSRCQRAFKLEYPWQVTVTDDGRRYACSEPCKAELDAVAAAQAPAVKGPRRIAVFNHKGGTGKTTTAVNVAAGLAERGLRVLLVDVDPQGNVGVALGVRGEQTLYHVLVLGADPRDVAVPVRANFDVITSNETLAAAELYLAARPNRDRILRERLMGLDAYDVIVLDCSPSLSLLNQNALCYADSVLIPVSCDYLALVGVKQCVRTLRGVHEHLKHPVYILGVVPTFYDARHKLGREVTETLKAKFGELCFAPVRANMKLREAPAAKQTIFEYAPDSHGAEDYANVVKQVAAALERNVRSSVESVVAQAEVQ
ncbi:MAG: ParA family protein [Myxococcales bacterium]|nr:ParA family protein [Myxococcales bacterium]